MRCPRPGERRALAAPPGLRGVPRGVFCLPSLCRFWVLPTLTSWADADSPVCALAAEMQGAGCAPAWLCLSLHSTFPFGLLGVSARLTQRELETTRWECSAQWSAGGASLECLSEKV